LLPCIAVSASSLLFCNDPATTPLSPLSLHDALPISAQPPRDELDELRVRIGRELAGTAVRLGPLAPDALRTLARWALPAFGDVRSEEHTSELQSRFDLVCRLLLEKKKENTRLTTPRL